MNSSSYNLLTVVNGEMKRVRAIADNLANSETPGYRRAYLKRKVFDGILHQRISLSFRPGEGSIESQAVDFSSGPIRTTGRPLDFAINGTGFFVVEKDGKQYYTRNGQFMLAPDGGLMTTGGLALRGAGGPIVLPRDADSSKLIISDDGTLRMGERTLARIELADFADPRTLKRVGPTLFSSPPAVTPEVPRESKVINRALEGSNTCIFEEMAELIGSMRSYEACQKMLKAQDEVEGNTIRQLS